MQVFTYTCSGPVVPNYQACVDPRSKSFAFCNMSLSIEARLDDLSARLNLTEKISMIAPQRALGDRCSDHTGAIERLYIPSYMWLTETNTAVASACYSPERCATTFNGPLGFGAALNRTLWYLKGSVIGTEMRAFTNLNWHRGRINDLIGITGFGPNINIARDPRFGRTSEIPGEDPFVSGTFAAHMLQGMQEKDAHGYPKMAAYLKHFTAYSTETNRGHDTYNISMHDLWETYLAQFEIAFRDGQPVGAMCSYNAINGRPSCANDYILNHVVRKLWSMPDAHITTDCNAIRNLAGPPVNAADEAVAAAMALNNGTDLEMGSSFWALNLSDAVARDLTTAALVDQAWRRSYRVHFQAGRFDDATQIEWSSLGLQDLNSSLHQQIQYEAAAQSFVLLKNDKQTLPLASGLSVAVVGPMGVTQHGLLSDYAGDQQCYQGDDLCIITIGDGIKEHNQGRTVVFKGVDINSTDASGIQPALDACNAADVVILALGIDTSIEHEAIDRVDTALPGLQSSFAKQVYALGKPTVLLLSSGGALAVDDLIEPASAIVEVFNPSVVGAAALGETLFGKLNRFGKLPTTMYPHDYIQKQSLTNYDMAKAPGRTYKYYMDTPLFAYGSGLSYTTFNLNCSGVPFEISCTLTNTGPVHGDEVVFVYHAAGDDVRQAANHPVPLRSVIAFDRYSLAAGESHQISFSFGADDAELVDAEGIKQIYPGHHDFIISRNQGLKRNDDAVFTLVIGN